MAEIKIIFEDESLLVLDKPAGMTVNRSDTTGNEETLQDWLIGRGIGVGQAKVVLTPKAVSDSDEHDYEAENREAFYKRNGTVHRLDKETSGIIIVAKTEDAFIELLREFREREVKKTYTALIHGRIDPAQGEISVPVGRLPWNRKRFGIVAGGRDATTGYKVLSYYKMKDEILTLLELYPRTGRTHQIRVHLKYMNRPIFADSLYGGRKTSRDDRKILPRQFLHASSISFFHPVTHAPLSFNSPLSEELNNLLSKMQAF